MTVPLIGGPDYRVGLLHIPHWLTNLIAWSLFFILWRKSHKYPKGHCQACGYNLRMNESGRCPECNTGVPINGRDRRDSDSPIVQKKPNRISWVGIVIIFSVSLLGSYGVYHRVGTTAAIDEIVDTPRYAGGFLAIGTSHDRPGALILSTIDRKHVNLTAQTTRNLVTGPYTHLKVGISGEEKTFRLRSPLLILIDAKGRIESIPLDWSRQDLLDVLAATNCSKVDSSQLQSRCGIPFVELRSYLQKENAPQLPAAGERYLKRLIQGSGRGSVDRT